MGATGNNYAMQNKSDSESWILQFSSYIYIQIQTFMCVYVCEYICVCVPMYV